MHLLEVAFDSSVTGGAVLHGVAKVRPGKVL